MSANQHNHTLTSDIELLAAALAQVRVSVFIPVDSDTLEYAETGIIRKFTPFTVIINRRAYVRGATEFHVTETLR